jgi:hypothetical protein
MRAFLETDDASLPCGACVLSTYLLRSATAAITASRPLSLLPPLACWSFDCKLLPVPLSSELPHRRLKSMPPVPAARPRFSLPPTADWLPCCGRHTAAAAEMMLGAAEPLARDGGGMSLCQASAV